MKGKVFKYKSNPSNKEITITIDEKLNRLKGRNLAPKKLDDANRILKGLKSPIPTK